MGTNPRSTVGTVTEIYTYLRLLYSRLGIPIYDSSYFSFNTPKGACEACGGLGFEISVDLDKLIDYDKSLNEGAIKHRTWKLDSRYFNIEKVSNLFDMDKKIRDYDEKELYDLLYKESTILSQESYGIVQNYSHEGIVTRLMKRQGDSRGLSINEYDRLFFKEMPCTHCGGSRLNKNAREVKVNDCTLVDLLNMELVDLYKFIDNITDVMVKDIVDKMRKDISNIINLGLGYLTLNRGINTLSNGESQKIKLARSMNTNLNELVYIMDEPTVGFHHRDVTKIVDAIKNIVSKNNTAIVVEHNRTLIESADNIIDIGPGSGTQGGNILYNGKLDGITETSVTGEFLKKRKSLNDERKNIEKHYEVKNVNIHNICNLDVNIPMNMMTCITGVSGSGKSSLIKHILERNENVVKVGKENLGLNSRSNVATYTKIFDIIRLLFAQENGVDSGIFSFNSKGACPKCGGLGILKMDMHFLGDATQVCDICHGKRYMLDVLNYKYMNKNIAEVLNMTVLEAIKFFDDQRILDNLRILSDVGLDYLRLGQTLDTLSGGEVQRVNMSKNLNKKGNIYVFDEPTQGLHLKDIEILKNVLRKMVLKGNTIIVVEHNLDFIVDADYIIDMGLEAGKDGGKIVFSGYPKDILKEDTYTARAIKEYIKRDF
ncbi:MAG: ATP-binding cassette domain-containing protein [Bacilli bacterium]|nr:ATP-binding cassette domain-containing protein [Bacilli bacterium]